MTLPIFLKKLGLKRLKTYAIPAKYDQERQETFKNRQGNGPVRSGNSLVHKIVVD
jgi:hypothetical protein